MVKKLFYISVFILFSCNNTTTNQDDFNKIITKEILVNPSKSDAISRSEFLSYVRIFKLETNLRHLITESVKLNFHEESMLITSKEVGKYNLDGMFHDLIGSHGKGPGEYLSVAGISFDEDGINILDRTSKRVLKYNTDGNPKSSYKIPVYGQAIINYGDMNIIYSGNSANDENKKLYFFDDKFKILHSQFNYNKEKEYYINFFDKTNFFLYKDSLRFLYSFNDTIYNINIRNKFIEIKPKYIIDFGRNTIPANFYDQPFEDVYDFQMALQKTNYAFRIMGFFETTHILMFMFWYGNSTLLAIHSKSTNKTQVVNSIIDDVIFFQQAFDPIDEYFNYFINNNSIYLIMPSYQFIERIEKTRANITKEKWNEFESSYVGKEVLEIYNSSKIEDNPIIIEFEIIN